MSPDAQRMHRRGRQLLQAEHYHEVVNLLSPWVKVHDDDAVVWELLAAAHFARSQWAEARHAAEEVVRLRPEDAAALCNLGVILRKLGRPGEAERLQVRVLEMAPQHERAIAELAAIERHREARLARISTIPNTTSTEAALPTAVPAGDHDGETLAEVEYRLLRVELGPALDAPEAVARRRSHAWAWALGIVLCVGVGVALGFHLGFGGLPTETTPAVRANRPAPVPAASTAAAPASQDLLPAPAAPAAAELTAAPALAGAGPTAASALPDTATRVEALEVFQAMSSPLRQGLSAARYGAALTAAGEKLAGLEPTQVQHVFWQELRAALAEHQVARQMWVLQGTGLQTIGVGSPQGQWALARYPGLRHMAVPSREGGTGRTTYELPLAAVMQVAWEAAAGHVARAIELRDQP